MVVAERRATATSSRRRIIERVRTIIYVSKNIFSGGLIVVSQFVPVRAGGPVYVDRGRCIPISPAGNRHVPTEMLELRGNIANHTKPSNMAQGPWLQTTARHLPRKLTRRRGLPLWYSPLQTCQPCICPVYDPYICGYLIWLFDVVVYDGGGHLTLNH